MNTKYIYFLRPIGALGPIKIGASINPQCRLRGYQIWSPVKLELAAFCGCHRNAELWFHRYFISDWLHGEWFQWSELLQSAIDHISIYNELPSWADVPITRREYLDFIRNFPKGKTKEVLRSESPKASNPDAIKREVA